MKKQTILLLAVAMLWESSAHAAIRDEWAFTYDPQGTLLINAINTGADGSAFEAGGEGVLEVNGFGALLSTPGNASLWEGIQLDADIAEATTLFMRYDLNYDLSGDNNVGTSIGISFVDNTGDNVSGLFLVHEFGGSTSTPAGTTGTSVARDLPKIGQLSAIAEVSTSAISVWYSTNGIDFVVGETNVPVSLASISELRIQATGNATGDPGDFVAVENIRIADTFEEISSPLQTPLTVLPEELTIVVGEGEAASAAFTLMNEGEAGTSFIITDNHSQSVSYSVVRQETFTGWIQFSDGDVTDPDTTFMNWNGSSTLPMETGFDFPLYGTVYTSFVAGVHGAIGLGTGTVPENAPGIFDLSGPLVAPFWSSLSVDTNSVRYQKDSPSGNDRLVVSWSGVTQTGSGGGSGMEFQAWLYANGQIRYIYRTLSGSRVDRAAIGVQDSERKTNAALQTPESSDSFLLTPVETPWVSYAPASGFLPALSSQDITILVDASELSPGTETFTITAAGGDGGASYLAVTVIVEEAGPLLTVMPSLLEFEGPAGFISRTNMILSNTGNVTLDYLVTDVGAMTNGYTWSNAPYSWEPLPGGDSTAFDIPAGTDTGTTPWIPLEFAFPFYGVAYTQMTVSVDGEILLGDAQIIGPYRGDLIVDGNAEIRYVSDGNRMAVTWENLSQKNGADDLTFQAVLYKNGTILCQYDRLSDADQWPNTDIGLKSGSLVSDASLVYEGEGDFGTAIFTTNYTVITNGWAGDFPITSVVGTNVVITYDETIREEAILLYPAQPVVITVDPAYGELLPGEIKEIAVRGDARSLESGGANEVEADTSFSFSTQPPVLISLVGEDAAGFDWINTRYDGADVYGVYQLRKQVDGVAVEPFSHKPIKVYLDGLLSQEEEVYAPELAGNFLPQGNKWCWGPSNGNGWYTVHIRLPWAGDSLRDPDVRAANPDAGLSLQAQPGIVAEVSFTATGSVDTSYLMIDRDSDGMPDLLEWSAGTDALSADSIFAVNSQQNPDGSRTLSWPTADDPLSRTYTIWYTTSLAQPWLPIAAVDNSTSYVDGDAERNTEPVVFYRVSVQ